MPVKVAIYGFYDHGNYGDDLMAILFAQVVKESGAQPCVYGLDQALATKYGIQAVGSIPELLAGAHLCILGGGGFLMPRGDSLSTHQRKVEDDCAHIEAICADSGCQIHAVSIGSNGAGDAVALQYGKMKLLTSDSFIGATVRLKKDVEFFARIGKPATHFPDVLWDVSSFWTPSDNRRSFKKHHIGVNIRNTPFGRRVATALKGIALARRDMELCFIRVQESGSEIQVRERKGLFTNHIYREPQETIDVLSELTGVISCKLHLGLTSLALGKPFVSLEGHDKTRSFLSESFPGAPIYGARKRHAAALLSRMVASDSMAFYKRKYPPTSIEELTRQSRGHSEYVKKLVQSVQATPKVEGYRNEQ